MSKVKKRVLTDFDEIDTILKDFLFFANKLEAVSHTDPLHSALNLLIPEINLFLKEQHTFNKKLLKIGTALSAEKNLDALLEMIVVEAMSMTNADGGTIYILTDDGRKLITKILQNRSLNIQMGGTSNNTISFPPLPLYKADESPNDEIVSVHVALTGRVVSIADVYEVDGFDFQGPKNFDVKTGYRSKSMLVAPLKNREKEVVGVLQLINSKDTLGNLITFSSDAQELIEFLGSQAAVTIENAALINGLKELHVAFIQTIAGAIDQKSPYTGGHIRRVAELTLMIARELCTTTDPRWADFTLNRDEENELKIAAWMHDIGKITTPEHIVDKKTKLETIYDRIHTVLARYEILKLKEQNRFLEEKLKVYETIASGREREERLACLQQESREKLSSLEEEARLLTNCNLGSEFMTDESIRKVKEISCRTVPVDGNDYPLLSEDEVENLCIRKGTLNDKERMIIQDHVVSTIKMLRSLPWPRKLQRVCEYAGEHHEQLNGKGYPHGLEAEELPLQSRILAVADIFEALTAADRPYRRGKTISEAVSILVSMARGGHLDPDIVDFFITSGMLEHYAAKELTPEQLDIFTYNGKEYKCRLHPLP